MIVPVLGVPVTFRVPSALRAEILDHFVGASDAASASDSASASEAPPAATAAAPAADDGRTDPRIRIELGRTRGSAHPGGEEASALRFTTVSATRLRVVGRGVRGVADAARGRARAVVDPAVAGEPETFRHGVLTTLALFLVTARDRQPVHAAAVASRGRALLLAAPGGTGKSTLAYALLRDGAEVLADDAAYLQARPRPAVWAMGTRISLPADARDRFPELAGPTPTRRADGRERILVPLADRGPSGPREPAGVCLLERDPAGVGALEAIAPEIAVATLLADLAPGFDRFADTMRPALDLVAHRGAWRLALPTDPARAAAMVRTLLA